MQTIAQQISDSMDNDGSLADNATREKFFRVLRAQDPVRVSTGREDVTRYEFRDGSSIVVMDGAWDLGIDDERHCGCWLASGVDTGRHSEACNNAHE